MEEIMTGGGKWLRFSWSLAGSSHAIPLVVANHSRPSLDSAMEGSGILSAENPGSPSRASKCSAEIAEVGSRSHLANSAADTCVMPEDPLAQSSPVSVSTTPDTLPGKSLSFQC